jgi:serine/threonine protein kinase/WD40 repeat protein
MKPTTYHDPRGDPSGPEVSVDDPRVVRALEEYLAALESGSRPERDALLARHPDIAPALAHCLDGLDLMQALTRTEPVPDPRAPAPLGDYRLLREVGRGGMGVVYEAEQLSLGRRVALKVLPFAATLDPRQLERFRNEARAAASLHHPHVVPVFAVGCVRGVHYYAMQFVEGASLAALIEERRRAAGLAAEDAAAAPGAPPARSPRADTAHAVTTLGTPDRGADYFRTVARLGVQAAEALEHAHQMGVVHRDVKPANLLLDPRGHLWVTDFGLAQFRGHPGLTLTGDTPGTLRYMSPEQALARRVLLDHRTDVYSLGATLYELLTLQPAVPGNDREELLRRITQHEPVAPRRLTPALAPELETIILKALARNPEERYGTAQELADDLQRFLDDRPIRARRPGPWRRLCRVAGRHRALLACLAAAAAVLLAGSCVGALLFAREKERLRRETAHQLLQSRLTSAAALRQARLPGYRRLVWEVLREAVAQDGARDHRNAIRAEVLACLGDPIGRGSLPPPPAGARRAPPPLSPGFRRLVQADGATGRSAVSPDGERLAVCSASGTVQLWGQDGGTLLAETRLRLGNAYELQFAPDGRLLAAACEEGVQLWFVPTLAPCWVVKGGPVYSVAIDPDARVLAAAGRQVEVWSLASNRLTATFPLPNYPARVEFSADGKLLLSVVPVPVPRAGVPPGRVVVAWSLNDTPEKHYLAGHGGGIPAVAFSPDGGTLATGSKDWTVKLWDAGSGVLRYTCRGHGAGVEALAFRPDGALLATGDSHGRLCLWDPASGTEVARLDARPATGQIWRLQFTASGEHLAAAGDGGVAVWRVVPAEGRPRLRPCCTLPHRGAIDLAVHPDGSALVFLDRKGRVFACDLAGESRRSLDLRARPEVRTLHFDAAGEHLTYLTPKGTLGLWDWRRNVDRQTTARNVFQLAVSGGRAATSNAAHALVVVDLETAREVVTLPPESSDVWGLAWSPDGTRVAVGLADGGLAVWDLEQVRAALAEFGIPLDRP